MARYIDEARRHANKIRKLHENAGAFGYEGALYHFKQIENLEIGALRSMNHKGDAEIIHEIKKSMQKLMDEMKRWQKPTTSPK